MTIEITTPAVEPGIGADGASLFDLLAESEAILARTGYYQGLAHLHLRETDPLGFEKVFARLRGGLVSAREGAMNISASPIVKELGELCFALFTPEGDAVALSTGIIVHVQTMADAIKFMVRNGWEDNPKIRPGDIFAHNEPRIAGNHNADVMTIVPIFWEDELVAWAGGVTHVLDVGASTPGSAPTGPTTMFEDGIDFHCMKIGEDDTLHRWHEVRTQYKTRAPHYYVLDERTRLVGCHMIRESVERVIAQEGVDRYRQFCREAIEEGRRAFKNHIRAMTVPGRYRSAGFMDVHHADKQRLPMVARRDLMLHGPFEVSIGADGTYDLDFSGVSAWGWHSLNCSRSLVEAMLWVQLTQTLICNDKINAGAHFGLGITLPQGSWMDVGDNPGATGLGFSGIGITFQGYPRTMSRALQSRGYIEEIVCSYSMIGNIAQGGGRDQYGRLSGYLNFEVAAQAGGGKYVLDGLDHAQAAFNPEGDAGDIEMWELTAPLLYLGRSIAPNGGYCRHRGGTGFESLSLVWGTNEFELENVLTPTVFDSPGLFGGYPAPTAYIHNIYDADLLERAARREFYPVRDGDPENPALLAIEGRRMLTQDTFTTLQAVRTGDLYLSVLKGAGGLGDPLLRPVEAVETDVRDRRLLPRFAEDVYGVSDRETQLARRRERGEPVTQWFQDTRQEILDGSLIEPVKVMLAESMRLSPRWAAEYRGFWDLPADFVFDVPTATLEQLPPTQDGRITPQESAAAWLAGSHVGHPEWADAEPVVTDTLTAETLADLLDERLTRRQVKDIQSAFKDHDRFDKWVALLQSRVPYDDVIVLPFGEGLNIVRRSDDDELIVRCDCGHDFCEHTENWKLHASLFVRDSIETMREVYPERGHPDPSWMELREYTCPSCARLLETEAVPPGYPVVHEFLPDIEGFYTGWLGRPVP